MSGTAMPAAAKLTTERNSAESVANSPARPSPLEGADDEGTETGTGSVRGDEDAVLTP